MHPSQKQCLKEKGSVFSCVAEDDSTRTSLEWLNTLNVWFTGVGDRILDFFSLALIGSILSLSALISV